MSPEESSPEGHAWWRSLLRGGADSRRLILLLLVGVLAVQLGFVAVDAPLASWLIAFGGYYFMLGVFAAFLVCGYRLAMERRSVIKDWIRNPGWAGLAILAGSALLILADRFGHKVLFDEYVLQSTAEHMHMTKQVGTPYRGFMIEDSWVSFDVFLDKRPYFFVFLVSLVHDLTGYRVLNMMLLNAALTPVLLGLVYYCAKALSDKRGGLLAVALMSTLPLLAQNATGAGMELHNLVMIVLTLAASILYLRAPDGRRLTFLCLCTVLLSQSRYESAIFAAPVALVILLGWHRTRQAIIPWTVVATPLLFVPYAWHNRVLSASPALWQLHEGQSSRFSTQYVAGNLEGLWHFLFNGGFELSNSWYLSGLGGLSILGLLVLAWRGRRRFAFVSGSPALISFVAIGAGVAANLGMLMFYYWARLDDPVASRFALPICMVMALGSALFVYEFGKYWRHAWTAAMAGLALYLVAWGGPSLSYALYTEYNLVPKLLDWQMQVVDAMPAKKRLIIANKSHLPWMLRRVPAVLVDSARLEAARIKYHMEQGTFDEVLVIQTLRPTSPEGKLCIDSGDALPANFKLECLAEIRLGPGQHRISRLVSLTEVEPLLDSPDE